VLVKWKQEKGENTQWIFGVDHAGIGKFKNLI
jgi:valyl-tRNA synthetase